MLVELPRMVARLDPRLVQHRRHKLRGDVPGDQSLTVSVSSISPVRSTRLRMAYMGRIFQIVLNNFSIIGEKFLRIFFEQ
jgi:hypothetical protein